MPPVLLKIKIAHKRARPIKPGLSRGGEVDDMKNATQELLTDCSTGYEFCFSLACAECGQVWRSRPIRFSRAGVQPEGEGKRVIYETLYDREKKHARQQAAVQATEAFSACPICGRLVCDHCFLICDDLDMCVSCAHQLQEQGEPVL